MKTPKRNKGNGYEADCFPFEGPNQTAFEHARWKRKNKIAQLKRSLKRYKDGEMLPKLRDIRLAYMWMQELRKPSRDASFVSWEEYIAELKAIQQAIIRALVDAASCQGAALEREDSSRQCSTIIASMAEHINTNRQ